MYKCCLRHSLHGTQYVHDSATHTLRGSVSQTNSVHGLWCLYSGAGILPTDIEVVVKDNFVSFLNIATVCYTLWNFSVPVVVCSSAALPFILLPQESQHAGKTGVVRAIAGKMASVYLYDGGQEVDIPTRYLEPTPPNTYDKVDCVCVCVCLCVCVCVCVCPCAPVCVYMCV